MIFKLKHDLIKLQNYCLPLLTGFSLGISWNVPSCRFFLFFSFIPLLIYEEKYRQKDYKSVFHFIIPSYFALVIWNLIAVGWIIKMNFTCGILVVFLNSLILNVPLIIYSLFRRKKFNYVTSIVLLSLSWLSIEFLQNNWELAFPYLILGNALASFPKIVQWYEFTGVLGGSAWVLLMNFLLFPIVINFLEKKIISKNLILFIIACFLPIFISLHLHSKYKEIGNRIELLCLHPNTSCADYKYKISYEQLITDYFNILKQEKNDNLDYIIWPETSITKRLDYQNIQDDYFLQHLRDSLCRRFPRSKLISGCIIDENIKINTILVNPLKVPNLKQNASNGSYFFTYNAAIQINCSEIKIPIHTKSKLVPIEETIPYPKLFNLLTKILKSLGNFKFTYRQNDEDIFVSSDGKSRVVPLICYESLFGEETSKYVVAGANILVVILNEGWYKNLTVSKHFVDISIARAIENRRSIARSSNCGITCFIDQKGEVTKSMKDFKQGFLKGILVTNNKITFYCHYGDYIGKMALFFLVCIIIYLVINKIKFILKS